MTPLGVGGTLRKSKKKPEKMNQIQDDIQIAATDTPESLWEQFERTGSVQAFLKFQRLSGQTTAISQEN